MNAIAEVIATVIGAVGGWEAIKYVINMRTNRRKEEAEADSVEFTVLRDTVEFLQQQLQEKEQRFAEQTGVVRKLNMDVLDITKEKGRIELELHMYRCEDKPCPWRMPPNAYTGPKPGSKTKEEYHNEKDK